MNVYTNLPSMQSHVLIYDKYVLDGFTNKRAFISPSFPSACDSTRFVLGEGLAALQHIHDLGFSFNDLKPENILVTSLGHIKVRASLWITLVCMYVCIYVCVLYTVTSSGSIFI